MDAFLNQNNGEGWFLPSSLKLSEYGLGKDSNRTTSYNVSSLMGERFYEWQLSQNPKESWEECAMHAENIKSILGIGSTDSPEVVPKKDSESPKVNSGKKRDKGVGMDGGLF
jgi:hypothetical protein